MQKKNLRRCERWLKDLPPPPLGMSMLTDSMVFFSRLPLVLFTESSIYIYIYIYIYYIYTNICICPLSMHFFKVSHWPSDHMISLRPLIGQPSFTTKLRGCGGGGGIFLNFFFCLKASWRRQGGGGWG